jgi:hypothetical protein
MPMKPGDLMDRFGTGDGRFLSPDGTPFAERSLPPDSLNPVQSGDSWVDSYHRYEVVKAFDAKVAVVAPAFGQPGGGLQVFIDKGLVGHTGMDRVNVDWMVRNGYLKELSAVGP